MNRMLRTGLLAFGAMLIVLASSTSDAQQAQESRSFGIGAPFGINELPPGQLRKSLENLAPASRERALGWLRRFSFPEQDLAYLRVDRRGGVFYEDPTGPQGAAGDPAPANPVLEPITTEQVFALHSKPGASRTVYLDMDGHVVTNTIWNTSTKLTLDMRPYNTDGDETTFSETERNVIAEVWKRIAEDYAAYDIDVTTEEPTAFGPNVGHILVTRKVDKNGKSIYTCNCGGVAYVDVWGESYYTYYQPALVFLDGVGGSHNIAEAASHELGHNLSLSHDGTVSVGYYQGHGTGMTDWGPIMGVGYYAQVTQWSKGEYRRANNTQDDVQIIGGHLNLRVDDHVDVDFAQASPITTIGTSVTATTMVSDPANSDPANTGIIEDRSDVDLFYVDSGAGVLDLTVTPAWVDAYSIPTNLRRGMNLDVQATLYDETEGFIAQSNPAGETDARITTTVGGGRYILAVSGVGVGDPLTNGYSDYGSTGHYFINGTVPQAVEALYAPEAPADVTATLSGTNSISLSWTDQTVEGGNEDAYRVFRQIVGGTAVQVTLLARDSISFDDNNLANGSYVYWLEVFNSVDTDVSNVTDPITIYAPTFAHATSEATAEGAIASGSYLNTTVVAGIEVLSETHQGGRPQNRVSKLDHTWDVTGVTSGAVVTLSVDAEAPANNEGDDFIFSYAINGQDFDAETRLLTNGTGRQPLSWTLPPDTAGTVTLRVEDVDRTSGNGSRDTVSVHHIEVATSGPADNVPTVVISAPLVPATADVGTAVVFSATAMDDEDDDAVLSGTINWESNLYGGMGSGASITVTDLAVGMHVVTARATDSAGQTGSAQINVSIVDPNANATPIVSISAPVDGTTVFENASITFSGTASDLENGDVSSSLVWTSNIDTIIGYGESFSTTLPVGTHTITATATDSVSAEGSDQISVTVQAAPAGLIVDGMALSSLACAPATTISMPRSSAGAAAMCGSGFVSGATVTFENGSGPSPSASVMTVLDAWNLTLMVNVPGGGPRKTRTWDVRMTNPDGGSAVCTSCLVITP